MPWILLGVIAIAIASSRFHHTESLRDVVNDEINHPHVGYSYFIVYQSPDKKNSISGRYLDKQSATSAMSDGWGSAQWKGVYFLYDYSGSIVDTHANI